MARRAVWRRLAEEDLNEAYLFIGANSPALAERFVGAVEDAVRLLSENPAAGHLRGLRSPRARGLRSWVVRGFPAYIIFYSSNDQDLEIARILYGSRDIPRLLDCET